MESDQRRDLVEKFLRRCVIYANESIRRKRKRGEDEETIAKWTVYRDFTEHAVEEVAPGPRFLVGGRTCGFRTR